MGSARQAVLVELLLVFAAIGHLLCVASFSVESAEIVSEERGMTGKLIHRDQHFVDEILGLTQTEIVERSARLSNERAAYISRKARRLAAAGPAPKTGDDWETPLSFHAAAYLMEISLGTPATTLTTIADTGSDLTWVQCSPCQACSEGVCGNCQNHVFNPSNSTTYAALGCSSLICKFLNESGSFCPVSSGGSVTGCDFGYAYGDGSQVAGYVAQETVTLSSVTGTNETVPDYFFGCTHQAASNSSLLDGTDGLVGLGRGNISFPSQLGSYFGNKFGYCLINRTLETSTTLVSSPLYFGADAVPATTAGGPQLQYTPMIDFSSTFYYVGCEGISLGGKLIPTIPASAFTVNQVDGSGGLILDSGTTYTSLAPEIFDPLSAAIEDQITGYFQDPSIFAFNLCYLAKWSDWVNDYGKGVPIISFQFSNTTGFPLLVDTAWIRYNDLTVCLAITNGTGNPSIFGSYQMVDYHVLFDTGNSRVGFVSANCTQSATSVTISSAPNSPIARVGTSLVIAVLTLLVLLEFAR